MIERLCDSVSHYQEYEVLLGGNRRFQEALAAIYYDILIFLKKAKNVFMTKGSLDLCLSYFPVLNWSNVSRIHDFVQKHLADF